MPSGLLGGNGDTVTAARELVRRGPSPTGPEGLLGKITRQVLETALNEETTGHLGYRMHDTPTGEESGANVRNGTRPKTVLTESTGHLEIELLLPSRNPACGSVFKNTGGERGYATPGGGVRPGY